MAKFTKTDIPDVLLIQPEVFFDYRGQFFETYNSDEYSDMINEIIETNVSFVTDDISISRKNVLRGLHGDTKTWKLVQCFKGEVFSVVVDLRQKNDYTFKTFTLNDINKTQLLIPPGCVNGYLCISDDCIFSYKQSEYYTGGGQISLKWNSIEEIKYPIKNPIVSERDENANDISYFINTKGVNIV